MPKLDYTGGCFPLIPLACGLRLQTDYIGKEGDSMEILYVVLSIILSLVFAVIFAIVSEIIKNLKK